MQTSILEHSLQSLKDDAHAAEAASLQQAQKKFEHWISCYRATGDRHGERVARSALDSAESQVACRRAARESQLCRYRALQERESVAVTRAREVRTPNRASNTSPTLRSSLQ